MQEDSPMTSAHGNKDFKDLDAYCDRRHAHENGERFGRIWPSAPPLFTDPLVLERLGAPSGAMDDADKALTTSVAMGQVFFGQFVDHDITLDLSSSLSAVNTPEEIANARTPTLDLDCVYGLGPEGQPYLYDPDGDFRGIKLITGADVPGGAFKNDDLPRLGEIALIGDFRNDENRVVSQIQLAMIQFHNKMVDELADEYSGHELFEEARRLTMWHYQWAVVHDFLVAVCGDATVTRILSQGRRHYRPKVPFIPVEFSVAGFRFGHSMVPMEVQVQPGGAAHPLFGDVYGRGFSAVSDARARVNMGEIFGPNQRAARMDGKLASDLLHLSERVDPERRSLATRNMVRGQSFLLPSGETVAALMERPQTEIDQVTAAAMAAEAGLMGGTPLWFYILTESGVIGRERKDGTFEPGEGLGPVGATLVAEVIIGLIELDPRSWLGSDRNWRPEAEGDANTALTGVGAILAYGQAAGRRDVARPPRRRPRRRA